MIGAGRVRSVSNAHVFSLNLLNSSNSCISACQFCIAKHFFYSEGHGFIWYLYNNFC